MHRSSLAFVSGSWLLVACATEPEPPPELEATIVAVEPIGGSRYRITAELTNLELATNVRATWIVPGPNGVSTTYLVPAVTSSRFDIETIELPAFTSQHAAIDVSYVLDYRDGRSIDERSWTTAPPEIATVTDTVGDASTLTVTGTGLGSSRGLLLGIRSSATAAETVIELPTWGGGARVPILLSPPLDVPRYFDGAVPPATVYLKIEGADGFIRHPVGTTQLRYRVGAPVPAAGPPGTNFELALFHPARAPDLAGLTVTFDGVPITPQTVNEHEELTAVGAIYLTRAWFRVPAGTAPGPYQLRVVTAFGEELLANGSTFEVVTPL